MKPDKSRYVYLYLPSAEEKARWERLAKEAGVPLSKFVIGIVDNALADETEIRPRGQLLKEIGSLRQDNSRLREELKLKSIVLEKYEAELKRYRSEAFLGDRFEGVRKYYRDLIDILQHNEFIDNYRLLEALGIDPKESELIKALSHQLEDLEAYGLVESTPRGWRWIRR